MKRIALCIVLLLLSSFTACNSTLSSSNIQETKPPKQADIIPNVSDTDSPPQSTYYTVTYLLSETASESYFDNEIETGVPYTVKNIDGMVIDFTAPEGKQFVGWKVTEGETDKKNYTAGDIFLMPDGNVTLIALWETIPEPEPTYYSVTYLPGEGTGESYTDSKLETGIAYTVKGIDGTIINFTAPEGKQFIGWKASTENRYTATDTFPIPDENVTLTALWETIPEPEPTYYSVTYLPGEGTGESYTDSKLEPGTVYIVKDIDGTIINFTAPEGKQFIGWKASTENRYTVTDTFPMPDGNVTLTALWETIPEPVSDTDPIEGYTPPVVLPNIDPDKETEALQNAPAPQPVLLKTSASGIVEKRNNLAVIDYSHTDDGYVMVQYTDSCDTRLKVQVKGPISTYTYNITPKKWEVFPLSEGNGTYQITIYRNVSDSKYAAILSVTFQVSLKNEFTTFLYPNQYVDYSVAPNTVEKAYQLTKNHENSLDKVAVVYDYVVDTLRYDKEKAASIQSGYLPNLDEVLASQKGICFDYAALMTGMLRSQGIPCKLIVGYAGNAYHAWISVWAEESGWIDGVIFFDGIAWQRMDPTFASSSNRSESIMKYIGDGSNYKEKYLY